GSIDDGLTIGLSARKQIISQHRWFIDHCHRERKKCQPLNLAHRDGPAVWSGTTSISYQVIHSRQSVDCVTSFVGMALIRLTCFATCDRSIPRAMRRRKNNGSRIQSSTWNSKPRLAKL
ncbi:hypothetical protein EGW08_020867, partial [Elysia chlorotica]